MFTKRIIPCLDCKDGRVVKGTNFVDLKDAGDPVEVAFMIHVTFLSIDVIIIIQRGDANVFI